MKICVLATSYPRHSGDYASVFVHGLCKTLAALEINITAVVPHEQTLKMEDEFDGVRLKRFRYFWPASLQQLAYGYGIPENLRRKFWAKINVPFFCIGFLMKAWKESRDCDLIHAHWEISALVAIFIKWRRKVPVVLTVHRLVANTFFSRRLTHFLLKRMDMLHFNSTYTRDQAKILLETLPANELIYPSVDDQVFQPAKPAVSLRIKLRVDDHTPIILGLGRLVEKKGFCYLIEAFAQLQKRPLRPAPFLLIAGGGPLLTALKAQAQAACMPGSYHFTNFVLPAEVLTILQETTVMVVPSILDSKGEVETLGVVTMEAMACALPVIASRIGGLPDVVVQGETGWLVPPADPQSLTQTLEEVLQNPARARSMGQKGRARVIEYFSWTRAGTATKRSYESLLAL